MKKTSPATARSKSVRSKAASKAAESSLYLKVVTILEEARALSRRAVNTAMVRAYWLVGEAIVEEEQRGKSRADYGARLVESLAVRLTEKFGKGFNARSLWRMRDFYLKFPILTAVRSELSWTHYRMLLQVENPDARAFYESEAAEGNWSTRQLERQITTLAYERVALSKNKRAMLKRARAEAETSDALDFIKDPFVLEFLGLRENKDYRESDLEAALLDHLRDFMLELGRGFAFVGRQVRITLDGDHFYIDLVFYNYLLRRFILFDLKLGKLTHQDLGQMLMYTNYYGAECTPPGDQPPIGVVLCADKNDAVVRYTLGGERSDVVAARYQMYLPSEAELRAELLAERARLEHVRAPGK
jgi:predicted nuclease of restriction endonuclease-like (RecB) superfamily